MRGLLNTQRANFNTEPDSFSVETGKFLVLVSAWSQEVFFGLSKCS